MRVEAIDHGRMTWRRVKVRSSRAGRILGYVLRSLVARLFLLVVVFAAVPIVLYEQFREADESRQAILLGAIREKGMLIGRAMTPILGRADSIAYPQLGEELARFTGGSASVRLLFRPAAASDALGFYYVASAPPVATDDLAIERQRLIADGILHRLAQSCEGELPLALRIDLPDGRAELLTSIAPVLTQGGCWALVSSNTLSELGDYSLGLPYWKFPEVRIAGAIYLALAAIVLFVFFDFWHSLRSFGRTARNIVTDEGGRFAEKNYIPEMGVVAREFDRMVDTLQESALSLRRAAEDNAHAFKTPIGIIRQSLEPIRRRLSSEDVRATRALSAINSSLDKLDGLIATARRLDRATADSLDPPRERVNLSNIARAIVSEHGQSLGTDGPRVSVEIADGLTVIGSAELIETVMENVFDNAVSFSPWRGVIRVHAKRDGRRARLVIEDEGPGVPPDRLNRIFDRYYSVRPMSGPGVNTSRNNFGIGLWIVRRNIEAMGGRVFAENRKPTGLRITIELPAA
jgi:two-component system, OmpR family, sensor histidine kinase ChvG